MSVPFRERNPVVVGAVSLAVIALLILAAFRASDLPLIGGGDTYYAAVSEAGGLKANDEVRVAGVRVGKVQAVDLAGDHVRVEFTVEDTVHLDPGSVCWLDDPLLPDAVHLTSLGFSFDQAEGMRVRAAGRPLVGTAAVWSRPAP